MTAQRHIGTMVGALALAASIAGAHAGHAAAQTRPQHTADATRYSFQSFASPHDKTFTQLLGINDHRAIAGYDGSGQTPKTPNKGFTLTLPSHFTAENYPHSAQTQVIAINNWGDTGGFYVDKAGVTHDFLDIDGKFATADLPGTTFNQILSLNNGGAAAGYDQDAAGVFHPYIYTYSRATPGGSFTPLAPANTQATGIDDGGMVSGCYIDGAGLTHGFQLNAPTGGTTTLIRVALSGGNAPYRRETELGSRGVVNTGRR